MRKRSFGARSHFSAKMEDGLQQVMLMFWKLSLLPFSSPVSLWSVFTQPHLGKVGIIFFKTDLFFPCVANKKNSRRKPTRRKIQGILLNIAFNCFCRCNVVINCFENAYRVAVTEDVCDDCSSQLLDVNFNKVRRLVCSATQFSKINTSNPDGIVVVFALPPQLFVTSNPAT